MHDCRQTRAQLFDLVFDELPPPAAARLRAELETCAPCQSEYRALGELLRACDGACAAAEPPADFWPGYHARLASSLHALDGAAPPAHAAAAAHAHRAAFSLRRRARLFAERAFNTRLRVPVPAVLA